MLGLFQARGTLLTESNFLHFQFRNYLLWSKQQTACIANSEKDCRSCDLRSCASRRQGPARFYPLSPIQDRFNVCSVQRDQQEANSQVGTSTCNSSSILLIARHMVCGISLLHLGHTAVVSQALTTTPNSQDRGHAGDQQWRRSTLPWGR